MVLALRWALSYTDQGLDMEFETWRVYWKSEDQHGFRTRIYLHKNREEQFDSYSDEMVVVQEHVWHELATLVCHNQGVTRRVIIPGGPYGSIEIDAPTGIQRLLEDAMLSSCTASGSPINRTDPKVTWLNRLVWGAHEYLGFTLRCNEGWYMPYEVHSIDFQTRGHEWR